MEQPRIEWSYPAPRKGLNGELDKFLGPGATPAETWLQLGFALGWGALLAGWVAWQGIDWTPVQWLVGIVLAVDMAGGVVTNASSSAKRWYHRAGQGARQHFGFVAVHVVQIFLAAWLFRGLDLVFFGVVSACLLGAALVILKTPLYLKRPVALGLAALSVPLSLYGFSPTPGLEWFVPFLFLKLLVAHLVREEPYWPG